MFKSLALTLFTFATVQVHAANAECDFVTQDTPHEVLHLYSANIVDASSVHVGVEPHCQSSVTHYVATSPGAVADGMFKIGVTYQLAPRDVVGTPYCAGSDVPASLFLDGTETYYSASKAALNAVLTFKSGRKVSGLCYYF